MGSKTTLDLSDFHCMDKNLSNHNPTNLQNILFCVPKTKECKK